MSTAKQDFLAECLETSRFQGPLDVFKEAFCRVCQNSSCTHSQWGESQWLQRMRRQEEALFNPIIVDPHEDPLYAEIAKQEFIAIDDHDVKLYGGWVDVGDHGKIVHMAEPPVAEKPSESVEDAAQALRQAKAKEGPRTGTTEERQEEPSGEAPEFRDVHPPQRFQPGPPNKDGVMVGQPPGPGRGQSDLNSSVLLNQPDPWAISPPSNKTEGTGTGKLTVRIGDGKVIKRE